MSGYDLRLMSPVEAENDILTDGQNLIIVADVRDTLHFRIFDTDGRRVMDTDETELAIFTSGPEQIAELKKNLSGLWQNPQLSRSDKDRVSSSVRSAVGRHYVHHYDDTFASIMGHDYVSYYDIAFPHLADLSDDFFFNSTDWPMSALAFSLKAGRAVTAPAWGAKGSDEEEGPYDPRYPYSAYPLQLWDFEHIREPRPLNGHTSPIMCADMTGDGKWALTGSRGRMLRLWDLDSGVCLQILRGHRGIVYGCALSEDARLAVSGSEDMTVRLWDLVQGKLLFTFAVSEQWCRATLPGTARWLSPPRSLGACIYYI